MFMTNVIILGTAFLVQKTLLSVMGSDYNGINGLFTSIISMMSLTDLGIGSAIIYHLYRPAAESDYHTICSLLNFYRRSYVVISGIVILIGIILVFFLPKLIGTVEIDENLYLIFSLFMADCLVSYFLSYKKSLLYAYQMNYILDGIHFLFYMIQNTSQMFVLFYFQSYIGFLLIKTISKVIENMAISFYIKKKYSFTNRKKASPLASNIRKDIFIKIKALLFHRLGKLIVTGSDSLVITGILGIFQMSLFTNYHLIIGGITALLNKIFETLTSSVGNFLLDSHEKHRYEVYRNIDFLNFWFFGCATVVLYTAIQPVIILWVGKQYLFSQAALFWLMIKFYQEGMRASVVTFKEAAGIYHEDRFVPIIEAMMNVILSIFLAEKMGMKGVFLGTIISAGVIYFYSFPKYVCKPLFHMSWGKYVWQTLQHLTFVVVCMRGVEYCVAKIAVESLIWKIVLLCVISTTAFHFLLVIFYGKSNEMKYFVNIILKSIIRRKNADNV